MAEPAHKQHPAFAGSLAQGPIGAIDQTLLIRHLDVPNPSWRGSTPDQREVVIHPHGGGSENSTQPLAGLFSGGLPALA